MRFLTFYEQKDWRERYVWHITPTGQHNRVLVKSLSPDEQEKYKPKVLKKQFDKKKAKAKPKAIEKPDEVGSSPEEPYFLDFYYGVKKKEDYNKIEEGKLIKATDRSGKAIEFSDQGLIIVEASNVPVKAVAMYKDDEGEFVNFPEDMSEEEKYEFVKFEENDEFMLDLFPYTDIITLELSNGEEEDEL